MSQGTVVSVTITSETATNIPNAVPLHYFSKCCVCIETGNAAVTIQKRVYPHKAVVRRCRSDYGVNAVRPYTVPLMKSIKKCLEATTGWTYMSPDAYVSFPRITSNHLQSFTSFFILNPS